MKRLQRIASIVGLGFASTVATACSDESLTPLNGGSSSSGDASSSSGDTSSSSGGTPIRQVFVRNPWGEPPNNLLVDGDFEFSLTTNEGQYGWLLIDETGGATLQFNGETGGLCRSGLRCGVTPKGTILFGRGTAAPELAPMRATLFVKPTLPPEEGDDLVKFCKAAIDAYMISCDTFDIVSHFVAVGAPDATGWCEYGADVPGSLAAVCVYSSTMKNALVDAATLLPSGPPPTSDAAPKQQSLTQGSEQMKRVGQFIRSRTRFDRGPLPEANR